VRSVFAGGQSAPRIFDKLEQGVGHILALRAYLTGPGQTADISRPLSKTCEYETKCYEGELALGIVLYGQRP